MELKNPQEKGKKENGTSPAVNPEHPAQFLRGTGCWNSLPHRLKDPPSWIPGPAKFHTNPQPQPPAALWKFPGNSLTPALLCGSPPVANLAHFAAFIPNFRLQEVPMTQRCSVPTNPRLLPSLSPFLGCVPALPRTSELYLDNK